MKLNQKSGATIAMTAAALLVSSTIATSPLAADGTTGKCYNVNETARAPAPARPLRTTARATMPAKARVGSP